MSKGRLFVISGASGVGKSTVLKCVMGQRDDLIFSVSATTRKPRPGERNGVHYFFITKETFEEMIRQDAFLEYDAHMDHYYGTPKDQLNEKLARGNVILDIDVNGALCVKSKLPQVPMIFIAPPSIEELERRLRSRGDTSEAQIKIRLERAAMEMELGKQYEYIVINDRVETCADEILKIIAKVAD